MRPGRVVALARANLALTVLLAVGATVRIAAMAAYPPALFFGDSWGYVVSAFSGHPVALSNIRPSGYPVLLRILTLPGRNLELLVAVQHLAGLVTGTLVYVLLRRARVPRWGATAAAALILLDGYAIALEQHVMTEAFFTLTVLGVGAVLAWRSGSVTARMAGLSGLLLAAAILQRTAGWFVLPAAAGYLLWTRVGWRPVATFLAALALPLVLYAAAYGHRYGPFALTQSNGWFLYGRVAGFADCGGGVPADERPLCETSGQRDSHPRDPDWYIFDAASPAVRAFGGFGPTPAAQAHSNAVLGAFARRMLVRHPFGYVEATATDLLHYATPGRRQIDDAQASTSLPKTVADENVLEDVRARYLPDAHPAVQSPAAVVRAYRNVLHVPRPVLVALALAALAALIMRTPSRREILLFGGTGILLVVGSAATAGYGLRYLVPAVPPLAVGGALAARDLTARVAAAKDRRRAGRLAVTHQ